MSNLNYFLSSVEHKKIHFEECTFNIPQKKDMQVWNNMRESKWQFSFLGEMSEMKNVDTFKDNLFWVIYFKRVFLSVNWM